MRFLRYACLAVACLGLMALVGLHFVQSGESRQVPDQLPADLDLAMETVGHGDFWMGSEAKDASPDEKPMHLVSVKNFEIDRYEVTNAQYRSCVTAGDCSPPAKLESNSRTDYFTNTRFDDYPVIYVSWYQATAYCAWLDKRLPTEAEWEKAARGPAPSLQKYPWGDEDPDCSLANYGGEDGCLGDTDRVGSRPRGESPYGVQDMAGNVWEWVADWYHPRYYSKGEDDNPKGPYLGRSKVMRGGCWSSDIRDLRVTCRYRLPPAVKYHNIGFRCARNLEVQP